MKGKNNESRQKHVKLIRKKAHKFNFKRKKAHEHIVSKSIQLNQT